MECVKDEMVLSLESDSVTQISEITDDDGSCVGDESDTESTDDDDDETTSSMYSSLNSHQDESVNSKDIIINSDHTDYNEYADSNLNVTKFKDLKTRTITYIAELNTPIMIASAFNYIPIVPVYSDVKIPFHKKNKKIKVPNTSIRGAIMFLKSRGVLRGFNNGSSSCFKHSVSICICAGVKNMNIRLSRLKMHLSGGDSMENSSSAIQLLVDHINTLRKHQLFIRRNKKEAREIIEYVVRETKGKTKTIIENGGESIEIVRPIDTTNFELRLPDKYNTEFTAYLLSLSRGKKIHSVYSSVLNSLLSAPLVCREEVKIKNEGSAMINKGFHLGFPIDRQKLKDCSNTFDGFVSIYDGLIDIDVKITREYKNDPNYFIKKKRSVVPHHTFVVCKTGSVLFSGPDPIRMENVYIRFMEMIDIFKEDIIGNTKNTLAAPTSPSSLM